MRFSSRIEACELSPIRKFYPYMVAAEAKGRKVYVSGPLTARTYQANDGTTRVSLEVTADDVEFLSSRNDDQAGGYAPAPASAPAPMAQNSGFTAVETDELPF